MSLNLALSCLKQNVRELLIWSKTTANWYWFIFLLYFFVWWNLGQVEWNCYLNETGVAKCPSRACDCQGSHHEKLSYRSRQQLHSTGSKLLLRLFLKYPNGSRAVCHCYEELSDCVHAGTRWSPLSLLRLRLPHIQTRFGKEVGSTVRRVFYTQAPLRSSHRETPWSRALCGLSLSCIRWYGKKKTKKTK